MSIFFIHTKDKLNIDFSMFHYRSKNCLVSYENHWQKPNGDRYIKYTKFPVVDSCNNELKIGDFNNYGHVLRKVDKILIFSNK